MSGSVEYQPTLVDASEQALVALEWWLLDEPNVWTEDPADEEGDLVERGSEIGAMLAAIHDLRRALGHPDAPITSNRDTWSWRSLP